MRNEGKKGRCGSVSTWCSEQRNGFATPERRKFRRVNGLQFPLHPQQVTGWIVILIIVINTFTVLTPHLEPNSRSILTLVIAAIFLTHISSHLVVLLMDPADPRIRSQPTNKILPEFDRDKHSHVIENGRCHLCNITTDSRRTKHCSICNKCIVRFDHHCKWLNNCIGARNYSAFLVCLISAILANLFVAGLSATELSFYLIPDRFANYLGTNEADGANGTMENTTTSLITPVPDIATIVAMFAIGVLSVVAAILLLHLCFFHGYIACLGLTTYEYVRKKREKASGRPIGDGVDPRSNLTATHEHAPARCVALSLQKSATKAIRSSGPYPENDRVTRNARLRLSVPRWCSNADSNRDQSTNSNVSVGLQTSLANPHPRPSVQLVHDAMHCCSMFDTLARSSEESTSDTADSVRVSTITCASVQRVRTFLRAYLSNGKRRRCKDGANVGQRSHESTMANGDSSGEIVTAFPAKYIVPPLDPLDPLDNPYRSPATTRLQKTLGPSAHGRLHATRTYSRKLKSRTPQSAKLSPILESELSTPDTPRPPNSSQSTFPPRIDRLVPPSPEV